jgi:hypothetical protein
VHFFHHMQLLKVDSSFSSMCTLPRLPMCTSSEGTESSNSPGESDSSTASTSHSNSIRYRHNQTGSSHETSRLSRVVQSTKKLSKIEISTGGATKMPSIDSSRSGRLLVSTDQLKLTDRRPLPTLPTGQKLNKLIRTTGMPALLPQ